MKTPVTFIIFNRPRQTKRVFEAIRAAKPEVLLVVADGPRNAMEKIKCEATRAIIDSVDWKCDVRKNYSEKNIGCRKRVSSGLDWVFEEVDRAIILEDDCLPHPSFFPFCEELLGRYANDEQVMHISGDFFQQRNRNFKCPDSYYFSDLPHIWGWASWSRAWKHYDSCIKKWPEVQKRGTLREILKDPAVYEYWETVWDGYHNGTVPSWDGQWTFACMLRNGLSINPTINLVSNIGFGPDAMQAKDENSIFANIPSHEIKFPLIHPKEISVDHTADAFTFRQNFGIDKKLRYRLLRPIKTAFPKQYKLIRKLFRKK